MHECVQLNNTIVFLHMENEVEENKLEVKIEKRTQTDVWR
jgi:hypothetical protein